MRILGNASDNWTRTYRKYPSSKDLLSFAKNAFRNSVPKSLAIIIEDSNNSEILSAYSTHTFFIGQTGTCVCILGYLP